MEGRVAPGRRADDFAKRFDDDRLEPDCCHFNGEGNRILSEAIAVAIETSFGTN